MTSRLFIIALFAVTTLSARHRCVTFNEALKTGLISAKALSAGGYQGYCMKLQVSNKTPDSLDVQIDAGTLFNSVDNKYQDILMVKEEHLKLKRYETNQLKIKGYCCQSGNYSPFPNCKYDFAKKADSNLVRLAQFLSAHKLEPGAEQNAVWAISNNHPTASILSKDDLAQYELRKLVAAMKHEKTPWYLLNTSHCVDRNGRVRYYSERLSGTLSYTLDKDEYVTLTVYDASHRPVCLIRKGWALKGINRQYDLDLPVKNLTPGQYTVELCCDHATLATQSISL